MSRLQRLQAAAVVAQRDERGGDRGVGFGQLLTTREAADLLRYDGPRGIANFFKWADRHNVPRLHRGSRVLWQASVLRAFLCGERWARRHAESVQPVPVTRKRNSVARKGVA